MPKEIWKDVAGYEGLYAVSNLGNIKRLEHSDTRCRQGFRVFRERPVKPSMWHGYLRVQLWKNNKRHYKRVHRIVAEAFIPNLDERRNQVNHIDGDKTNNNADNLEWCTCKENVAHAIKTGLFNPDLNATKKG